MRSSRVSCFWSFPSLDRWVWAPLFSFLGFSWRWVGRGLKKIRWNQPIRIDFLFRISLSFLHRTPLLFLLHLLPSGSQVINSSSKPKRQTKQNKTRTTHKNTTKQPKSTSSPKISSRKRSIEQEEIFFFSNRNEKGRWMSTSYDDGSDRVPYNKFMPRPNFPYEWWIWRVEKDQTHIHRHKNRQKERK